MEKCEIVETLTKHAQRMRLQLLKMAYYSGKSTHIGGGLSIIDALAVLYGSVMNTTQETSYDVKDKFILSKGHAALSLYVALAEYGVIEGKILESFMQDGSNFGEHPIMNPDMGIEASTGSLGQGISMAVGIALAAKKKGYGYNTYVVCGNGESNEGLVWEACMAAANFKLDNFTLFLDNNHLQCDGPSENVMDVSEKYAGLLKALGFQVIEIDGNDIRQLYDAFMEPHLPGKPKAVVGSTVKGKGISFMENNNDWHHNYITKAQFEAARSELEAKL